MSFVLLFQFLMVLYIDYFAAIPTKENGYIFTEDIAMPIGNVIFSAIVIDRYGMVVRPTVSISNGSVY